MKEEDLMIGDWVETRLCRVKIKVIKLGNLIYGKEKDKKKVLKFLPYDLRRIRLTPEILEKNGFAWGYTSNEEDIMAAVGCGTPEQGWVYDEGAGEIKIIFPHDTDGGLIRIDDQRNDRHLELIFSSSIFVNDLQHALRLCKINKKIIV